MSNKRYSGFNVGFINVNSICNKIHLLFDFVVEGGLDVLGVAKLWLLPSVRDSFVSLSMYEVIRCDTTGETRKHGVCIYIRNGIKFYPLEKMCENVCCVHLVDFDVFLAVVYHPPSNGPDKNVSICRFLYDLCDSREVLVLGDFNLPAIQWGDGNLSSSNFPPLQRGFLDCFFSLSLTQWVLSPTFLHSDNILDLVLTSEEDRLGDVVVHPALPGCRHSPITYSYFFFGSCRMRDEFKCEEIVASWKL